MKCPYNVQTESQIQAWLNKPNDDGAVYRGTTVTQTSFMLADCLREQCGAFYNGRCCYAAVNLDNR